MKKLFQAGLGQFLGGAAAPQHLQTSRPWIQASARALPSMRAWRYSATDRNRDSANLAFQPVSQHPGVPDSHAPCCCKRDSHAPMPWSQECALIGIKYFYATFCGLDDFSF